MRTVLFFGFVLPALMALAYSVTRHLYPRLRYQFYRWQARRSDAQRQLLRAYDVAIFGHLLVLAVTKIFGKRAGQYVYRRVF